MVEFSMAKGSLSFSISNRNVKKRDLIARVVLLELADEVIK